jgi:hypothetical protein
VPLRESRINRPGIFFAWFSYPLQLIGWLVALFSIGRKYGIVFNPAWMLAVYITLRAVLVAKRGPISYLTKGVIIWRIGNWFMMVVVLFAINYWDIGTAANFGAQLSKMDALYFSLGTMTTAGTGTIAPVSALARSLVSGQMILEFVFVSVAVTIAITSWSENSGQADQAVASNNHTKERPTSRSSSKRPKRSKKMSHRR